MVIWMKKFISSHLEVILKLKIDKFVNVNVPYMVLNKLLVYGIMNSSLNFKKQSPHDDYLLVLHNQEYFLTLLVYG